jgi:hypothetical protein
MKRLWLLSLFLTVVAHGQSILVYDQQSPADGRTSVPSSTQPDSPNSPNPVIRLGQSFTPSLSGIDFVELRVGRAGSETPTSVLINLRQDSILGTILGSTETRYVPLGPVSVFTLYFPNQIPLLPGTTYFFDVQVPYTTTTPNGVTGSGGATVDTDSLDNQFNYHGGVAYRGTNALTSYDLWFREGTIVPIPEPSSIALFTMGGGLFAFQFWRKTRRKE